MTWGCVFPGQGSQQVGMLADLMHEPEIGETFLEADAVLRLPLGQIVREGPAERLNRTEITQPALLTASVALWRLWTARGGTAPAVLAGHSLGEYSALVAAGALDFGDAVTLVHERGRLMQEAVPEGEGAMAAILGLDAAAVVRCCAEADAGVVSPANYNAPGQIVIAGATPAVETAIERCKAAGAKRAMRLAVSVPSHCPLMAPAASGFASALGRIALRMPSIPVIHNVDAEPATSVDGVRDRLVAQLSEPVRWTGCILKMAEMGVTHIAECGPGKILAGLVRRIDKSLTVHTLGDAAGFGEALGQGSSR